MTNNSGNLNPWGSSRSFYCNRVSFNLLKTFIIWMNVCRGFNFTYLLTKGDIRKRRSFRTVVSKQVLYILSNLFVYGRHINYFPWVSIRSVLMVCFCKWTSTKGWEEDTGLNFHFTHDLDRQFIDVFGSLVQVSNWWGEMTVPGETQWW